LYTRTAGGGRQLTCLQSPGARTTRPVSSTVTSRLEQARAAVGRLARGARALVGGVGDADLEPSGACGGGGPSLSSQAMVASTQRCPARWTGA
jgi:hypothetical protein